MCVRVRPGRASCLLAPWGWRLHAWVEITCAGALCGLFMNQLFCSDFPLHSCLFRTGPYTRGGREGKSVEETGVSRPHLTVNPSPGCDPQGVYIHGLSPWRWSLVLRLWNENRLAGQTDRSQGCNVTHTAPSSWAAEPATCMIAFRNSELKRKIPSKILSHCCIPFTWECIEK